MRESGRRTAVRIGLALAALAAAGPASASCEPLSPGTTLDLPGSLTLACGTARCRVSASGHVLAEVALAREPKVCDTTSLHLERDPPAACDQALSRTGLSLRQTMPGKGGPLSSQVVLDVLGQAPGIPWSGSTDPIRACLPRYAGKRGDVWQYTWRGGTDSAVFQVFEEDEAPAGHGSGDPRAPRPAALVLSVTPDAPSGRPGPPRPRIAAPAARAPRAGADPSPAPDVTRF